jgi:hypothetical protein
MESFVRDVLFAFRSLKRQPGGVTPEKRPKLPAYWTACS